MSSLVFPVYRLSQKNTQSENTSNIAFEKEKGPGGRVNRVSVCPKAAVQRVLLKKWEISKNLKNIVCAGVTRS